MWLFAKCLWQKMRFEEPFSSLKGWRDWVCIIHSKPPGDACTATLASVRRRGLMTERLCESLPHYVGLCSRDKVRVRRMCLSFWRQCVGWSLSFDAYCNIVIPGAAFVFADLALIWVSLRIESKCCAFVQWFNLICDTDTAVMFWGSTTLQCPCVMQFDLDGEFGWGVWYGL